MLYSCGCITNATRPVSSARWRDVKKLTRYFAPADARVISRRCGGARWSDAQGNRSARTAMPCDALISLTNKLVSPNYT